MKTLIIFITGVCCLGFGGPSMADILELKNGTMLNGKYAGGTAGTVRFETGAGVQVFESSQIMVLTFTTPAGTVAPATPEPAAPAGAMKKGETITLPAGTLLEFTLTHPVSIQVGA